MSEKQEEKEKGFDVVGTYKIGTTILIGTDICVMIKKANEQTGKYRIGIKAPKELEIKTT